jgi:hypothetical protein
VAVFPSFSILVATQASSLGVRHEPLIHATSSSHPGGRSARTTVILVSYTFFSSSFCQIQTSFIISGRYRSNFSSLDRYWSHLSSLVSYMGVILWSETGVICHLLSDIGVICHLWSDTGVIFHLWSDTGVICHIWSDTGVFCHLWSDTVTITIIPYNKRCRSHTLLQLPVVFPVRELGTAVISGSDTNRVVIRPRNSHTRFLESVKSHP